LNKSETNKAPIPANVRVMIALVAGPTLMVIGMLFYTLFVTGWRFVSISMIIFSLLGFFAYYVVIAGKLPSFRRKTSDTEKS
jgi:disulfide bond formation protein DsbB